MRELPRTFDAARVAGALYLISGFAGAMLAAAGLVQLFEAWPPALELVLLGGALAAVAWHRGQNVLGNADPNSSAAGDTPAAPASKSLRSQRARGTTVIVTRSNRPATGAR
jgi:hypothetical protein